MPHFSGLMLVAIRRPSDNLNADLSIVSYSYGRKATWL